MKGRKTYLELGRRERFGKRASRPAGPIEPPPRPQDVADFELGSWHVQPTLARISRGERVVQLDEQVLAALLILAERPPGGVNRDVLILRIYGPAGAETHADKIRRVLSALRRLFSEDGSVRLVNVPGDCYDLEIGPPREDAPRPAESSAMLENPAAIDGWLRRGNRRGLGVGIAGAIVVVLAVTLVALIDRKQGVLYGTVTQVAVLAGEPGQQLSPSFSQDGRLLVYSWHKPDASEKLYIRVVGGGPPRALTHGDGRDRFPAWSPTGGLIAFQRTTGDGCVVMVVPADGGEPRRVAACDFGAGGPMTWLRDGLAVTYSRRVAWTLPLQIVSVNVNDGKMIGVTSPVAGMPGDSSPSLASTGRRLAFVRTRTPGYEDLTLLELGGGAPERLTKDALPVAGIAWEPRGLSLVYAAPRGGYDALWRIRLDGAAPIAPVIRRGEPVRRPALSGDGRSLAYEHWHVATRFVMYGNDPDASGGETLREGDALDRGAQLSADRGRIAFVSNHAGREQLWVAGADGKDPTPLTIGKFDYLETPRWAPDGGAVAFTAARDGHFGVWVVDVATHRETKISDDGENRAPSFSRDGRWLYFGSTRNAGHWQLFRRAWPQGTPEQITAEGGLAALESSDGELLYYVRADRRGLWRRSPAPGGDDTLVTPELAPIDWRNWDVGRDAIWFVTRPAGDATLARFVFAQGRVSAGPVLPDLLPDSGLTITADGKRAIIAETASAQVDIEVATLE